MERINNLGIKEQKASQVKKSFSHVGLNHLPVK
jgi:hypothetical protein